MLEQPKRFAQLLGRSVKEIAGRDAPRGRSE
jgi:hypothetical protein